MFTHEIIEIGDALQYLRHLLHKKAELRLSYANIVLINVAAHDAKDQVARKDARLAEASSLSINIMAKWKLFFADKELIRWETDIPEILKTFAELKNFDLKRIRIDHLLLTTHFYFGNGYCLEVLPVPIVEDVLWFIVDRRHDCSLEMLRDGKFVMKKTRPTLS